MPFGEEETLRAIVERLSREQVASFLAVLKRFGAGNDGHLSFPVPGWTLALDIPAHLDGLPELLRGFDDLVAGAGGRIYLAKDSRMDRGHLGTMYPRLDEWREVQARLDPEGTLRSDMARRLGLGRHDDA